ncbi:MAG TPA: helix-turn-helix domain-containing protein [Candidatus Limnocylindrales bacterium]|nr:helix-turn-helix domain-containing protein [Candidatus Limnocylindrales bacterium]
MPTFAELRSAVLPGARWLAAGPDTTPSTAATLDLAWVRLLRARVPAFDALERGDLAIAPRAALAVVAPDPELTAALVRGCIEAGIGGIVLVGEGAADDAAIAAIAAPAGLPVLDAAGDDPAAVERSAIGFLVNRRGELERQATILETRLERVALDGAGPEGLAAAIAGFLGRAVAIEGRRGATLAVHLPPDVADAAAAVAAYHDRKRTAARILLPIPGEPAGAGGGGAGALALLGDRPQTELERVATARVAGLLALELARDEAVGRALETARRETLPADGPPWVVVVARQTRAGEAGSMADAADREALRRDLRGLAPARRLTLRGDALSVDLRLVAALEDADPAGLEIAGRIGTFLDRLVAVSRPFVEPTGRSAAEAEARQTLEAAETLEDPPRVARADRLAAYRLLGNLHNVPDGPRQARALLAPLLRGRPDVRREHLATLRALLDHPGLAEAAASLGVHRNTVAYRLRRIEELTGWSLADPDLRFPLALALRLVQDE